MEHCQHFNILLYMAICVFGQCFSVDPCQPLVNEGSSYTMTTSCPASENKVQFYWTMSSSYHHGRSRRLHSCNLLEKRCYNSDRHKFSSNYSFNATTFTGSLKIKKVTAAERSAQLQCVIWDLASQEFVTLKTCTVKTYHAPETPVCHPAMNLDTNKTDVTCTTSKVYPDIFCKLFEGAKSETGKEIPVKMTYNKTSYRHHRKFIYNSASCSFELPAKHRLNNIFIKMFAFTEGSAILGSEKTAVIKRPAENVPQPKYFHDLEKQIFNGSDQLGMVSLVGWLVFLVFFCFQQFST